MQFHMHANLYHISLIKKWHYKHPKTKLNSLIRVLLHLIVSSVDSSLSLLHSLHQNFRMAVKVLLIILPSCAKSCHYPYYVTWKSWYKNIKIHGDGRLIQLFLTIIIFFKISMRKKYIHYSQWSMWCTEHWRGGNLEIWL